MVKGRQGERVRLYVRGTILGYKRSKSNQYPNTSLLQIEGVNSKDEVSWLLGLMGTVASLEQSSSLTYHRSPWVTESECSCIPATFKQCLAWMKRVGGCYMKGFIFLLHFIHVLASPIGAPIDEFKKSPPSIETDSRNESNYGFKYPIFLTMCHMTACSLLSYVAIAWLKMVPMQTIRSRIQFMKISALSLVFCISVVFGNISLRYLPVSFNQAVGATTPFFTAVFAYLMTMKREAWLTYVTLIPVVTGVIIASGGEPSFHLFGFIICIAATAARALKSVLQGILLSSEGEKLNSMNLLLYMAPIAVVFLLPAALFMEENVVGITLALAREDKKIIWYLLFNSALAYFVNLTNFLVTKHTSALTLQVLGNAKGAVAVVISILIFRNPVSVTGMLGYLLTVIGVILYSESKKRSK
ncbi:putative sugar phosphate/phosphate translocator, partial [Cucurbita argyrosperma subsp. sororia]